MAERAGHLPEMLIAHDQQCARSIEGQSNRSAQGNVGDPPGGAHTEAEPIRRPPEPGRPADAHLACREDGNSRPAGIRASQEGGAGNAISRPATRMIGPAPGAAVIPIAAKE